jgi:hypothetical protein
MEEPRGERPQENHVESYADWKNRAEKGHENPRELFQQVSRIAQYMSYDLIDKLQYWEKESLKLTDPEIEQRIKHVSRCLSQLQSAYVQFSETDF